MTSSPADQGGGADTEAVEVWVDQDLCTGDGLCVQLAPEVFEFDIDGLAYVKDGGGELKTAAGARVPVPSDLRLDVLDSAVQCPGECIHVARRRDGAVVGGPDAA
jgi:ferredoxin